MSPSHAILTGAVIIAAAILIVNGTNPAVALGGGPYQLMHHSNAAANAGVFRLDTGTGEVSYCFLTGANGVTQSDLACTKAVR